MIKTLYNDYFQKSKVFLYPLLMIPKGSSVTPICTYTSLKGHYDNSNMKLTCEYHIRDDKDYKTFEKKNLFGNQFFHDFFETSNLTGLYVFNLEDYKEDWEKILAGKYSSLRKETKAIILYHYASSRRNHSYVDSYLNPDEYFDTYARLLGCEAKLLKTVGELCDKPDLDKEIIDPAIKDLSFSIERPTTKPTV
jgi:hypothetical protein